MKSKTINLKKLAEENNNQSVSTTVNYLQNKLIIEVNKILNSHRYEKIVTNGYLSCFFQELSRFYTTPISLKQSGMAWSYHLYLLGTYMYVEVFTDPAMKWDDNRIIFLDSKLERLKKLNRLDDIENTVDEMTLNIVDTDNYLL
jgi:hypothetical protein